MKHFSLPLFFLLVLLAFWYQKCDANHIYGTDIFYTHIDSSEYLVTVYAYRDCNGITMTNPGIKMTDSGSVTYSISSSMCCAKDITPRQSSSCDVCNNLACSYGFGIQRYTISGTVTLTSYKGCQFVFSWSDCCDGLSSTVYVECMLNRCYGDHSSPVYESDPVTVICVNQVFDRFQDASAGVPGDSVRTYFTSPLRASGSPIGFSSPHSYQYPITYTGTDPNATFKLPTGAGFHYDSLTGELQFKPIKLESSYFAMQADEYARDTSGKYYLSGTTMRRAIINIISCTSNHPPIITGINGGSGDSVSVCSNMPLSFFVQAFDIDKGDTDRLRVTNLTGGKDSVYAANWPTDSFSWTPSNKDVRPAPYVLTYTATDGGTPVPGMTQKRFYIFVTDSMPSTRLSATDSGCGRYHFALTQPIDTGYHATLQWQVDSNTISTGKECSYHTTLAGRHIVSLSISRSVSCTEILTDTIKYDTAYHKLQPVQGICKGASVQLKAINLKNLAWSPGKTLSDSTIYNPIAKPDSTTVYTVQGVDGKGCTFTDRAEIRVYNFNIKTPGDLHICTGESAKIYALSTPGAINSWIPDSGLKKGLGDTLIVAPQNNTTYKATVSYHGCIKKDSFTVFLPAPYNLGPDRYVCRGDSVHLHATGGTNYKWIDVIHGRTTSTSPDYTFQTANAKQYLIGLQMQDSAKGCVRTGQIKINVNNTITPSLSLYDTAVCPGSTVTCQASGGQRYQWFLPGGAISTSSNLSIQPNKSFTYQVVVSDSVYGCNKKDSLVVYVSPASSRYPEKATCLGGSVMLSASGGSRYTWSPSTGLSSTGISHPMATPVSTTQYTVLVQDSATTCIRTDTVNVYVDGDCVWPGDANKDKTADYLDVLNIGLGYGQKGPGRIPASMAWNAFPTHAWSDSTPSGMNYKHFDCNGDGTIDAADTTVITANYGQTHNKWTPGHGSPADRPVYFKFTKDTFYSGETATAYLYAGSSQKPLKGAYGIAVQAASQGLPVLQQSMTMAPFCELLCPGNELDYIYPRKKDAAFDAAFVETTGQSTTNTAGRIGFIKFDLSDSNSFSYSKNGNKIYARLLSATAIDAQGREINVYGYDDSAIVLKKKGDHSGIETMGLSGLNALKIYPDPASQKLTVEATGIKDARIVIYNTLGQTLLVLPHFNDKTVIDVSNYPPGLCFIEINTPQGSGVRPFLVTH